MGELVEMQLHTSFRAGCLDCNSRHMGVPMTMNTRIHNPGFLSKAMLIALTDITLDICPELVRDLIRSSGASDLLMPFKTALEFEMGLESSVVREVVEVVRDIRQDMEGRRMDRMAGEITNAEDSPWWNRRR